MLEWIQKNKVESLSWVSGRNKFADECDFLSVDEILKKYVYLSSKDVEVLIEIVKKLHGNVFKGIGLELGAGVGIFSALLSNGKLVDKVYALEIVPNLVAKIQKRVFKKYGKQNKLISTLGSFDDVRLEDNSCDFIFEYDSLHHSFDLNITLKEAYRVLKPGGVIIALDRVQSNLMNESLKSRLLKYQYTKEWLKENKYDENVFLSREMNGEHEIRENEWINYFEKSGFSSVSITHMVRPSPKLFFYSIITLLPDFIKRKTRYTRLSSYTFPNIITSLFRREPNKKNIGKFISCLNSIEANSVMIKSCIFAIKK